MRFLCDIQCIESKNIANGTSDSVFTCNDKFSLWHDINEFQEAFPIPPFIAGFSDYLELT